MFASRSHLIPVLAGPLFAALLMVPTAAPIAAASHPSSDPAEMTQAGSQVFFAATTAAHGRELWVTDGTAAGTHEVADINPGAPDSAPRELTAMGSKVYFFADDGTGRALWKSDGTAAGTKRLGGGSGYQNGLTSLGSKLVFMNGSKLWRSNGTIRGTRAIATINWLQDDGPTLGFGGYYYFFSSFYDAVDYIHVLLWRTDGTKGGTAMVAEIASADEGSEARPLNMAAAGGLVFFTMRDQWAPCGGTGEIWQTDGTAPGTHQTYDFNPGRSDWVGNALTSWGNKVFFDIEDEDPSGLWKTNGTESGTRLVKRVSPATGCNSAGGAMTAAGSRLYFFGWDGTETALWKTRGTARSTKKIYPIALPGCPVYSRETYCYLDETPAAVGSRLFFPAYSAGNGIELWVSDGSTAGTHLVKNIVYGGASSNPSSLAAIGSLLYFQARDANHGRELWVTDGTANGTHMVLDINPG